MFINFKKKLKNTTINNCLPANLKNIYEELYTRLIKPLYTTLLVSVTLLFILKSKSDHAFKSNKFKIYSLGFFLIIFLESSSKFITSNLSQNLLISILPVFFMLIIYLYFLKTQKVNKI